MTIQDIELENTEELEESTPEEQETEDAPTLESVEELLDQLDESASSEDNSSDTATEAEEVSLEAVQAELNEIRAENKKLISIVARLVKNYGAKLGESSTGIEAFRETSVEPKLPSEGLNLSGVPGLGEIQLG